MFKFILGLVIGTIVGFFYASLCHISRDAEERDKKIFEEWVRNEKNQLNNGDEN